MEIRKIKELTNPPEMNYKDYVWSPYAADYKTAHFNKESGCGEFFFIGSWVHK